MHGYAAETDHKQVGGMPVEIWEEWVVRFGKWTLSTPVLVVAAWHYG